MTKYLLLFILLSGCGSDNAAKFCNTDARGGVSFTESGVAYCVNGEYFLLEDAYYE